MSASSIRHDELLELRSEFPILASTCYLISNSLGAMPRRVHDRLEHYTQSWRTRGVRAWHEGWWELPVEVGDLVAPLLGASAGTVAMQPNVSLATAVFLSTLEYTPARNRIVFTELNFPSLQYLLDGEKKRGAQIEVVPSGDGMTVDLDRLLQAIDDRTAIVPISHVLFKSAFVQNAQVIAEHCRRVGAKLLLDVYQSAGTLPLELEAWGVDAAVGGCLKWLCGGPGNAFLWIRPELAARLEPTLTGWQSHVDPFAFEVEHRRAAGAWRFLTGTPAIAALEAARPGLEIFRDLSMAQVRERSLDLTRRIMERADAVGIEVATPRDDDIRGGTVTLRHSRAEAACDRLLAEDILCDYRPGAGIRFSPHFYTTAQECDSAVERLAAIVSELEASA